MGPARRLTPRGLAPDRLAGRILGMGDILTLVERAQEHAADQKLAERSRRRCAAPSPRRLARFMQQYRG
jgi:signal recognition particle GTPase